MHTIIGISIFCSFTRSFADDRLVSVYYYPWHDTNRHWAEGYLRFNLDPAQPPQLGEYSNRNSNTIDQHLAWSENFGIDNWIFSWWGPGSWEDETIRNHILPRMIGRNVSFSLFYEAAGLLNLQNDQIFFDPAKITLLRSHFDYIASNYFSHPNLQTIDERPVIYIYLTRTFSGEYVAAIDSVRQDMSALGYDVYLVGDEVYWGTPNSSRIAVLDAITPYNMHGPSQYAGYPSQTSFIADVRSIYEQYEVTAQNLGIKFIPGIMPGFNDRAVRLDADHYIIPRNFHQDSSFTSTFSHFAEMAEDFIDTGLNMVTITSFNEWHEDTQIEPTILTDSTNMDLSTSNSYTQGYYYKGYGTTFLQKIREHFGSAITSSEEEQSIMQYSYSLSNAFPNPFNPITTIEYTIPKSGDVSLIIYNIAGQEVIRLLNENQFKGIHQVSWNASNMASGIYFYRLQAGDFVQTHKLILLK